MNKLVIFILLAALAAGAFWYLDPDRARKLLSGTFAPFGSATTKVYKWKDAQGKWQLTDNPPGAGIQFEIREYRTDTNVLPVPPQLQK